MPAEMEGAEDFTAAAAAWIKKTIKDHERILFNGNGYSAEWEAEAEKRGSFEHEDHRRRPALPPCRQEHSADE